MTTRRTTRGSATKAAAATRVQAAEDTPDDLSGDVRCVNSEGYEQPPPPPTSTLVRAFEDRDRHAGDAIVLRGYLGRSDVLDEAIAFLEENKQANPAEQARTTRSKCEKLIPWRIYLTARLDRYVDFAWEDVLAWRPEGKDGRDAYTVWLRRRTKDDDKPIRYVVVQKSNLGAGDFDYLGGELIDDYVGQPGSMSPVWDEQSYFPTGVKNTYRYCTS